MAVIELTGLLFTRVSDKVGQRVGVQEGGEVVPFAPLGEGGIRKWSHGLPAMVVERRD